MKKLITFILIVMMGTLPVFAAESGDETQSVLAQIKSRIGNTDEYDKFSSDVYDSGSGKTYSFSWQKTGGDYKSMWISCTGSGIITNYSADGEYSPYGIEFIKTRLPVDEALSKAKSLFDKLNPDIADEIVIEKPEEYLNYSFTVKRIKNGLFVSGDVGRIELDKNAEKVLSLRLTYTENAEFLPTENLISRDEAIKNYGEKLGLELEYKFKYGYNKEIGRSTREIYVQYTAKNDKKINAVTGEAVIPAPGDIIFRTSGGGAVKNMMNADYAVEESAFSEAELKEIDTIKGLLTKDELLKIALENGILHIPDGFTLKTFSITNNSYYDDAPEKYVAHLEFSDDSGYASCNIDAKTGEIISFSRPYDGKKEEAKLSSAEVKEISEKAANALCKDKFSEYVYEENETEASSSASFVRYINGAKFSEDSVYVSVDGVTGEILSYRMNYTDIAFPDISNVIAKNMAQKNLFLASDYEVVYMRTEDGKMTPVYDFVSDNPLCICAFTGELLLGGEKYVEESYSYTDIDGHWAKTYIDTLSELGHGFYESEFSPEAPVTQKEFLTLLFGNGTDDVYEYIQNFELDIEKAENTPVSKEEAARIIVLRLGRGYASLAESDIFKAPFTDVTENMGYIAILKGKNIVSGEPDGSFNPKHTVTRAEAAVMIHNYLLNSDY